MNTNFKVIGLTRLGIKPKSTAPETNALTTRPSDLNCLNFSFWRMQICLNLGFIKNLPGVMHGLKEALTKVYALNLSLDSMQYGTLISLKNIKHFDLNLAKSVIKVGTLEKIAKNFLVFQALQLRENSSHICFSYA